MYDAASNFLLVGKEAPYNGINYCTICNVFDERGLLDQRQTLLINNNDNLYDGNVYYNIKIRNTTAPS